MSMSGNRGSDVRLTTGLLTSPTKMRFQHINPGWWKWKELFGYDFKESAHINELEIRAALTDLKRRTRTRLGTRHLVLLDSFVGLGVLTKKRSSSVRLQRVVRKYDALELASFSRPYFAYIRSHLNPADKPSRRREGRRPRAMSRAVQKKYG